MTQPGVASLLRGGVKPSVAGGSLRGLRVEAPWLPLPGVQGDPLCPGQPPMSAVGGILEREREPPWQAPLCGGQVGQAGREGREAFQQWERSFSFLYSNEINTDTVSAERMPSSP